MIDDSGSRSPIWIVRRRSTTWCFSCLAAADGRLRTGPRVRDQRASCGSRCADRARVRLRPPALGAAARSRSMPGTRPGSPTAAPNEPAVPPGYGPLRQPLLRGLPGRPRRAAGRASGALTGGFCRERGRGGGGGGYRVFFGSSSRRLAAAWTGFRLLEPVFCVRTGAMFSAVNTTKGSEHDGAGRDQRVGANWPKFLPGRVRERRRHRWLAANYLVDPKTTAHLLKYDSTLRPFPGEVEVSDSTGSSSTARSCGSSPSAIRRTCRGASSAHRRRSSRPACSPTVRAPPSTSRRARRRS